MASTWARPARQTGSNEAYSRLFRHCPEWGLKWSRHHDPRRFDYPVRRRSRYGVPVCRAQQWWLEPARGVGRERRSDDNAHAVTAGARRRVEWKLAPHGGQRRGGKTGSTLDNLRPTIVPGHSELQFGVRSVYLNWATIYARNGGSYRTRLRPGIFLRSSDYPRAADRP